MDNEEAPTPVPINRASSHDSNLFWRYDSNATSVNAFRPVSIF